MLRHWIVFQKFYSIKMMIILWKFLALAVNYYVWNECPEKHGGAAISRIPAVWTSLMCIRVYFILEYVLIIQCHLYPWQYPVYTTVHTLANDSWINWIRMRNAVRLYLYAYMYTIHTTQRVPNTEHILLDGVSMAVAVAGKSNGMWMIWSWLGEKMN